jgi:hypothetical protein
MWEITDKWRPPRFTSAAPLAVQRVDAPHELGLAKPRNKEQEKLASDLAAVASVRVPRVELDTIKDRGNALYAISLVHGMDSTDLRFVREKAAEQFKSAAVQDAVKRASGLAAFYAWIGTDDQKDDHLVLDREADGTYQVSGVDFEYSFGWRDRPNGRQVIGAGIPAAMSEDEEKNIDKARVSEVVAAITALTDEQIRQVVSASPFPEDQSKRIADGLIARRDLLKARMKARGWLN